MAVIPIQKNKITGLNSTIKAVNSLSNELNIGSYT